MRVQFVTEDVRLNRETADQEVEADGSEAEQLRSDNMEHFCNLSSTELMNMSETWTCNLLQGFPINLLLC